MTAKRAVWLDVGEAVGEPAVLAATYYPAATPKAILVCLPGGTYNRAYWHLDVSGYPGYNFAEYAAEHGYAIVAVDPLGTGDSSKPARDLRLHDIAAALTCGMQKLPEITGSTAPPIAVAHSLGVTSRSCNRPPCPPTPGWPSWAAPTSMSRR
jgi:pimeloyl-ACP methyl ester carboxylesterase